MTNSMTVNSLLMKSLESATREYARKCVSQLASEYGFSEEDALIKLNLEKLKLQVQEMKKRSGGKAKAKAKAKEPEKKEKKEKVAKALYPMPFSRSNVSETGCQGLAYNSGLFTQCPRECMVSLNYCKGCQSEIDQNGKTTNGTIAERLACELMEFKDGRGRKPVAYHKVMSKLNVSREQVEAEAGKLNILIDEIHFVVEEKKTKAKKETVVAKEDDLISTLLDDLGSEEEEEDVVVEDANEVLKQEEEKALKKQQQEEEKALKAAEVAQKKQQQEAEKALKAAEVAQKKQQQDEEKALKAAKAQQIADEKAAKAQQIADEKAAKEAEKAAKAQQIADEKAAKAQQIADEKAALRSAKEKKIADEKAEKEKKIADEKEAKEAEKAQKKQQQVAEKEPKEKKQKVATKANFKVGDKVKQNLLGVETIAIVTELIIGKSSVGYKLRAVDDEREFTAPEGNLTIFKEPEATPKKVTVKRITIEGKQYLKTVDNLLYDPETKEEMGIYDPVTNTIKQLPDDDEDELSEDDMSDDE